MNLKIIILFFFLVIVCFKVGNEVNKVDIRCEPPKRCYQNVLNNGVGVETSEKVLSAKILALMCCIRGLNTQARYEQG